MTDRSFLLDKKNKYKYKRDFWVMDSHGMIDEHIRAKLLSFGQLFLFHISYKVMSESDSNKIL